LGIYITGDKVFITPLLSMSQQSALESNIDTLRNYIISNDNLKSELKSEITRLITQYNSIKLLGGEDMNKI
jgi:queuine/archaeosine tRNA-ribosyltransferase